MVSCSVGHRQGLDPALLLLWLRPTAAALIWPLAQKFLWARGAALKSKKQTNKKTPKTEILYVPDSLTRF